MIQILRLAAHEIVQHVSHNPAVLGAALFDRPNVLKVSPQRRRHCHRTAKVSTDAQSDCS
jgi:hypothetical protein